VLENKVTKTQGLEGWKAIPLALVDLDSNLVNIFMIELNEKSGKN